MKILHTPEKRFPTSSTISKGASSGIKGNCISGLEPKSSGGKRSNVGRTRSDTKSSECSKDSAEEASHVSRLFWVSHKEGLMRRNYQQIPEDKDGQAKQLCFQALIQWMGKAELGEIKGQQELKISAPRETSETQQVRGEDARREVASNRLFYLCFMAAQMGTLTVGLFPGQLTAFGIASPFLLWFFFPFVITKH